MISEILSSSPRIVCGDNAIESCISFVEELHPDQVFLLCDRNTKIACLPLFLDHKSKIQFQIFCIDSLGEINKSLLVVEEICRFFLEKNASRKSLVLILGGGILGDMGGFAASIYNRGMRFIQVPTSLLAMVDASVGGKTGVNFQDRKNLLGLFLLPEAVFIYPPFIQSLPNEERLSGFAEMVKHALLSSRNDWEKIQFINPFEETLWEPWIIHSVKFKKQITENDFREQGIREQLNLGHTVAHAIEAWSMQKNEILHHGYAVAAGILIELSLSKLCGVLQDDQILDEYSNFLNKNFPHLLFTESDIDQIIEEMGHDKKNSAGKITFCLLAKPGKVLYQQQPDRSLIQAALLHYIEYARRS